MKRFCVQSVITSSRSRVTAGDSQHSRHMRQEHVSTQHIAVMTLKAQNGHRRYHHSSFCRPYTCILTTAQPSYLHNLISLQPARSTRSSSVVTLSRPPNIFSLKITDRSFRYASPRLWNQLPDSFHQPHHSRLDSPPHPLLNSSLSSSPLSSSITPSLFHSRLKTYYFNKSFPP